MTARGAAMRACALFGLMSLSACSRTPTPADAAPPVSVAVQSVAKEPAAAVVQSLDANTVPASFVLPGRFAADTTVADLEQWFGKANVRVGELPGAEGDTVRGVLLHPDDATRRAYLYFQDEDTLRGLHMVRIVDAASSWRVEPGVRIGMPLTDLLRINGKPIGFFGFDWDYGGHVTDWNGGALAPRDGEMIRRTFRLDLPQDARGDTPYRNLPIGDGEFRSDDPRFSDLKMVVGEMGVSFPREDDL